MKIYLGMPIFIDLDENGRQFYQYGDHGTRYYFTTPMEAITAYHQSLQQAKAIHANQTRRKKRGA